MNSKWTLNEHSEGVLEVVVDGEAWENAQKKAFNDFKKNVSIKGFRTGKVPEALLKKQISKEAIYDRAVEGVANEALVEAVKEHNLELVARPTLDYKDASDESVTLVINCVVSPEVTLGEYKGLDIHKDEVNVTDEDVEAELSKVQDRFADWVLREEGQPAEDGDQVTIDFVGKKDGEPFEGGSGENYPLELGSNTFIPGFEEQLVGVKTDDVKDVTVTFPEDYQMTDYAGKEAVFKCKIHSISKEEIPELTDDFVKEISDFDTVDEWKADAKKKLEENAEQTAKVGFENALVAKLIDKVQDPIPHCMFEQRADGMMDAFANQLKGQNVDLDLYLQYTGMTKDQLKETYLERAENEVKLRLALEKIAELEGLEVADEELDAELTKLAEQYNMTLDDVKARIPVAEYKLDMLVTKALDLVKDSAVVDNSEPAEAEAEKTEEAPAEDKEAE